MATKKAAKRGAKKATKKTAVKKHSRAATRTTVKAHKRGSSKRARKVGTVKETMAEFDRMADAQKVAAGRGALEGKFVASGK